MKISNTELTLMILAVIGGFIAAIYIAVTFHMVFTPFLTWLFGTLIYGAIRTAAE